MSAFKDRTGERFGRLTVIELAEKGTNIKTKWKCKCDCGNTVVVTSSHLVTGTTNSCGCLRKDTLRSMTYKHGNSARGNKTRLYKVWQTMNERCDNPNYISHSIYHDRGIRVCDEWKDFAKFKEWAYANGYDDSTPVASHKCTIDRIDNNKGYEPSNCRWVDAKTQNNNKRNNKKGDLNVRKLNTL